MGAELVKQRLKNGVYRTLGEASARVSRPEEPELRVLMYHKVDSRPRNRASVPVQLFDEQMAQLRELGYVAVGLDAVRAHYAGTARLPRGAVLITFDDGYRDNLRNAAPVLQSHGYRAAIFPPTGYIGAFRPLPHDERLARRGVFNRTLDWDGLRELEAAGIGVGSHGVTHRPLASLTLSEARREIEESKAQLEDGLGHPVYSFAYVKGSRAHFAAAHFELLRAAGYELAFTSVSGANAKNADPLNLRRYNVEPFPARTFELLLRGACDLIALKDTVAGTHARRVFNAVLRTSR